MIDLISPAFRTAFPLAPLYLFTIHAYIHSRNAFIEYSESDMITWISLSPACSIAAFTPVSSPMLFVPQSIFPE
jgi:hypothetical protein